MSQHNTRGKQEDPENGNVGKSDVETSKIEKSDTSTSSPNTDDNIRSSPTLETKMGSTDSPAGGHGGGTSCGLVSSLFPNSCRGRAESFARRLHRRLTSLGGDGNTTDDDSRAVVNKATEITWLHAPTGQRTPTTTTTTMTTTTTVPSNSANSLIASSSTSLQTDERINDSDSHQSSESDVYYDFDVETEDREKIGNSSPGEPANDDELAKILVNPLIIANNHHESCHCSPGPRPPDSVTIADSSSDYVFSSPLPGLSPDADFSETFYDPESSETDKSRGETFHDPETTSESEVATTPINVDGTTVDIGKIAGRRKTNRIRDNVDDTDKRRSDDDSDTSTSTSNAGTLEIGRSSAIAIGCSSEESVNGRSSFETTSPSHESLWSTFDDSTVSLQDECPTDLTNLLAKSHSDSEIIGRSVIQGRDEVDRVDDVASIELSANINDESAIKSANSGEIGCRQIDEPIVITSDNVMADVKSDLATREIGTSNDSTENDEGTNEKSLTIVESSNIDSNVVDEVKTFETEEKSRNNDDAATTKRSLTIVGSTKIDLNVAKTSVTEENSRNNDDDDDDDDNDENEDNDDRPRRVRRCSSLKTGKTPPGTPGRKKIVRFADVLGLDLADVRTFLDEIPKIPNSAYSDLVYDAGFQKDSSPVNFWGTGPAAFTTPLYAATLGQGIPINSSKNEKILIPLFQQPGGLINFLDIVRERNVCLENIVVQDPVTICLRGTVRVRNLDFNKSVHVRYSLDCWKNFSDLQANYASNSCDGFSDKFTFVLYGHTLKIGQRLELAVRFQCKGTQYWDNNAGVNYCFQCLPATPANTGSYIPIAGSTNCATGTHEWSPTFY